jgi:hypothetical protein
MRILISAALTLLGGLLAIAYTAESPIPYRPKIQLAFFGHFRVKRNSHTKTTSELVS